MADNTNTLADVTVADLPDRLKAIDSVEELKRLQKADTRVTAQPLYDARIAELEPATDTRSETRTSGTATKREAAKRVKYNGGWYEPGTTISFASAKDAEPYDEDHALVPRATK